jgi:molybdopterin molybdotransferase
MKMPLMSVAEAQARLRERAEPVAAAESVKLTGATGRVLSQDVVALVDVPPAPNSAMDGYAVHHGDIPSSGGWLPVSRRIAAGADATAPLAAGTAARIFTGAELPPGADSVILQEDARLDGERVWLPAVSCGDNVRPAGQDVRRGEIVLTAGTRLGPQHIGLAASIGKRTLPVFRRLRVALLSTGDELVEPGEPLRPGAIYNSNRYLLAELLRQCGYEVIDLGVVGDQPEAIEAVLCKAAGADAILSSGGVSVGEEDHVRAVIDRLGAVELWKLAIKPGKPFAFGHVCETPYLALPGNPASAFVTFLLLCKPWLAARQGGVWSEPLAMRFPAGFGRRKPGGRDEYLRARAVRVDGEWRVIPHDNQSSGMLSSACWGNGLARVPAGLVMAEGDPVEFLPFDGLLG